jgi:hypothetical protein
MSTVKDWTFCCIPGRAMSWNNNTRSSNRCWFNPQHMIVCESYVQYEGMLVSSPSCNISEDGLHQSTVGFNRWTSIYRTSQAVITTASLLGRPTLPAIQHRITLTCWPAEGQQLALYLMNHRLRHMQLSNMCINTMGLCRPNITFMVGSWSAEQPAIMHTTKTRGHWSSRAV